jgi:hypothetical protein
MAPVVAMPQSPPVDSEKVRPPRGPWRSSDLDLLPENGARYEIHQRRAIYIEVAPLASSSSLHQSRHKTYPVV